MLVLKPENVDRALADAAQRGDVAAARNALQQGAKVDRVDERTGLTALHIATGIDNLPLVKLLVEECHARFGPDGFGRWPTAVAAECRVSEEMCDYIVEKEAAAAADAK
jgi:hypothetical protein